MHILYLEDNPNDALLTQHALGKASPAISMEVVHTLADAFKKLEANPSQYDLVLSDLNLPDGSGFSLLSHIRSKNLPYAVVVVTGQSDEDIAAAALKAGADDYIPKKEDYLDRLPATLYSTLDRHNAEVVLHSRALRVLYAESDPEEILVAKEFIEKHAPHIQLTFVTNADEIYKLINTHNLQDHFDVIVLDFMLPDFNAMEFLKDFFENKRMNVPVILTTSHGSEDLVSQAGKLGAADYVVKNPGYLYKLPAVIENSFHRTEFVREQAALREAETKYRVLVEQSPAASYIDAIDDASSSFFISNRIIDICGYPISNWLEDDEFWKSILHPDDLESVLKEHKRTNQTLEPFRMEYRMINQSGNSVWVRDEAIVVYNDEGKPSHWQGLILDISDQKQAEEALRRRDAIMEAISLAAEKFLIKSWRENIQPFLEQLGKAAVVSRTYIFQNRKENGRIKSDLIYEWNDANIVPQIDNTEMRGFDFLDSGFSNWITQMTNGMPVFGVVKSMSPDEQTVFSSQGILSIACMPIFVDQEWWGFIGIDECKEERVWRPAEIDALRTSANILGAAIQRLNSEYALQRQLNELSALQTVSAAGIQSTQVDEIITLTTQTLSNLLYPDNCGVYLYNETTNSLVRHVSYRSISNTPLPDIKKIGEGAVGKAFKNSSTILLSEINSSLTETPSNPEIKSQMAVPLRVGDRIIGILDVESQQPGQYSDDDLRLLTTISGQLSIALEKIRLLDSEHRRLQESETLQQAAAIVSTSLDLETVLDTILSSVKRVVPYDSACVFLIDSGSPSLSVAAAQGFPDNSKVLSMEFAEPTPVLKEILLTRQIVIVHDIQNDDRFLKWDSYFDSLHSWMGVPLIARDEVIGFLTLDSFLPNAYHTGNAVLAQTFAYQAAAAISNASLYEETRRRLFELEIMNRISSTLRTSTTEEQMLPDLLQDTLEAISSTSGAIWLSGNSSSNKNLFVSEGWLSEANDLFNNHESLFEKFLKIENPLYIPNFINDERLPIEFRKLSPSGWSGTGFPIRTSNEFIGVLLISIKHPRQFSRSEYNLLETVAEMAGNAIHRAQLFSHSQLQVERLIALRDVDIAISSSFDLRTILDVIVDHVISQLKVDAARILLYNSHSQTLDIAVARGFKSITKKDLHIRLGDALAGKAALENRMVVIEDTQKAESISDLFSQEEFKSYFNVPLIAKGQIKGVLEVFLRRPFSPENDWIEFLNSLGGQTAIAIDNSQLFTNLQRSNIELELAYDTTLEGWGKALEIRDQETEGHTQRVTEMTLKLARHLGVDGDDLIQLRRGALLHDIGKMGIPDEILRKPGTLNDQEWVIMRKHVEFAYALLSPIQYLHKAIDVPYCHHERWNGKGYPRGLKGEEIPISARIFAIIDVWDALLSDRPYRSAWARDKVIEYITEQSGIHFDPKIVTLFMELVDAGEMD